MYVNIEKLKSLIEEGFTLDEISNKLSISKSTVRRRMKDNNIKSNYFNNKNVSKNCLECENKFKSSISENRKFCSRSCSAKFNNKLRKSKKCYTCDEYIDSNKKYCSRNCYIKDIDNNRYDTIINGDASCKVVRKYLINLHGCKCMRCGWCEINQFTNKVPIELEHIDGNYLNNNLENLTLLCPNCHSLTSTYKALNVGNGRKKRMEKYYIDKNN
jgi:hypothetical protein